MNEQMYVIKHTVIDNGGTYYERGSKSTNSFPKLFTLQGAKSSINSWNYYAGKRTSEIIEVKLQEIV